ncbi:hypothetical protein [Gemmatimonas groenlandica]|uniref:Uncharacterized protein n=1 Tax=Gemmatimonas groenlandica TaxID=2732249 RepID=A0A6M4ISC9_9BACT|nr:hypothetical protein [Gemmatimonas groenlandica]QJR37540.1 hypothetical protein HKW67_19480 [Gemmatimonas groenlandica]
MNRAMRFTAGAAVVVLLGALATRLAVGPIHAVRNASECERAYAGARTHSDSISVTFLSFPDAASRGIRRRCGELHAAVVSAPGR